MRRNISCPVPDDERGRATWFSGLGWGVVFTLLCAACRGDEPVPHTLELARDFQPTPLDRQVESWESAPGADRTRNRSTPDGSGLRIEHTLRLEDWTPDPDKEGQWFSDIPRGACRFADRGSSRFRVDGREWPKAKNQAALVARGFALQGERLVLRPEPGAGPPAEAVLDLCLEHGREVDGRWMVRSGTFFGAGIPVWSGERESVVVSVPAQSRLSFRLSHTSATPQRTATFRLALDDAPLFEHSLPTAIEGGWHSIELPAAGKPEARLTFEVSGPPGLGVFFSPVICPLQRGSYAQRPWPEKRPNVVLFLADTFRADNLAEYGGAGDLTPNLNRLASGSVRFLEARSSASWTLPSINSVLTGLYPAQHGVNGTSRKLSADVDTLAEMFARAGYRTGAVTDAVFFTDSFGLEQGFEWFEQRDTPTWMLARTIEQARSFLEGDDGRPVFLVVHTYRTHGPFRTGREESKDAWIALLGDARVEFHVPRNPPQELRQKVMQALHERLRALYGEGVRAFDAGLGDFLGVLEDLRVLERGYLVFTADHGEAFGENGCMFHGGDLVDVCLRVPLLVHGHDLAPRAVGWSVSNVDVAPTLAHLAGLAPNPVWFGSSLLDADQHRVVFAFQIAEGDESQYAILEGHKKILAAGLEELCEGRTSRAYDLSTDRGEEQNLAGEAPWASELARRHAPLVRALLESGAKAGEAELDDQAREALEDLGYGGGD